MTDHPITPPPELVQQWRNLPEYTSQLRMMSSVTLTTEKLQDIATQAARWGADQELEACYQWVTRELNMPGSAICLREDRRPKPPSLKEQALEALERQCLRSISPLVSTSDLDTIRRALEALPD
jgi:hypothetical protein